MGLTFAAERFAFPSRAKFRQFCGQCRKTSIHENVCSNSSRSSMAPHDSSFPCAKKQQPNTKHATCKAATDRTGRRPRSNHSLMASVTLRDFASEPRPSEPRPLGSVLAVRKSAAIASFGANETKCPGSWRTMLFLKITKAHSATNGITGSNSRRSLAIAGIPIANAPTASNANTTCHIGPGKLMLSE